MFKIYDTVHAPCARKVRMFVAEKGIENVEYIPVDLSRKEQLTKEFVLRNPLRAVPVLELDDNTVITESTAICAYFEELFPTPCLMGKTALDKAQIQQWVARVEQNLWITTSNAFRHGENFYTGTHEQIPEIVPYSIRKAKGFLAIMDKHLEGREFIAADSFSFSDINAIISVDFVPKVHIPLDEFKNVLRWQQAMESRKYYTA